MQGIKYADAGMDMKKLVLCFIRKIRLVFLAAVVGAVLGGLLYEVSHIVPESEREYRAVAKIYLNFAADETGEVYQAYNGYTWNDLMATDPILDETMLNLPGEYTREEVVAAIKAEILSDLRLLTITVTTHNPDRCSAIMSAVEQSLVELGNTAKEFTQIEVIQTTEAALVVADSRTLQAVLVGLVTAVILMLLGMMFYYVLDDRILVASDLKQVTEVPFIGYAGAGERMNGEYESNLAYLSGQTGTVEVLAVSQHDTISQERWEELSAADGVVIAVNYGKVHSAFVGYIIEQLRTRGCRLIGTAIAGADEKFLRRYYGRAIGRMN
ncbi:MAG: hypothetical protein J1F18_02050 [Lachnospiraceae bacterium]|nr:hypothetical protein [Lachnospiraceae bacterium]